MAGVPFDQRDGEIWYDGTFVPWGDAKLHVLSHGLHYASAVFEGERAYGGRIFKSEEHTERLHASANVLGFEIPWTKDQITAAKEAVLERMNLVDAYIRPIAWRGSEMMGVSAQQNTIHLAIAAWEWPSYFKPEEVAQMRPLQRVGDVIAQRFKVVEEAESSLKKAKTSEDKSNPPCNGIQVKVVPPIFLPIRIGATYHKMKAIGY